MATLNMKFLVILAVALAAVHGKATVNRLLSTEFIEEINSKQSTWKAGRNFPENTTMEYLRMIGSGVLGIHPDPNYKPKVIYHEVKADGIPDTFDARSVWPMCESIGQIRNQGACGSCWAFGAVESMTDRLCIFSAGGIKFQFAPEDPLSCCSDCGYGCGGGFLLQAFQYWNSQGIVSGGDANSNQGCRPYSTGAAERGETPSCNRQCRDGYERSYNDDRRFGIAAYQITSTVEQIQHEILINGPVEAMYEVFEDFYNYRSGVYQHTSGNSVGWHAIKILGWGNENGADYWLVANSWGSGWGDLGGFFKILRGYNHVGIEGGVFAGIPQQ